MVVFRAVIKFIVMLLIFVLSGTGGMDKQHVISLVQARHAMLEECAAAGDDEQAARIPGIRSVQSVRDRDVAYTVFFCGGSGFGTATGYYGFYYSPGDVPLAVDAGRTEDLRPEGGGYVWQESWDTPGGDNAYYTERMMARWYYFESHF